MTRLLALAPAFAFAAACIAAPVAAEVTETSADHFVTRDSVTVTAAPKAAWLALISPGEWWNDAHTWSGKAANLSLTPQGGGCFCERLPEKDSVGVVGLAGSAQHMTVLMAKPMEVLRMRGGLGPLQSEPVDGVLTITMQAVPAGTRITMEYVVGGHMRFDVAKISKSVDQVMSKQLAHLVDKLGRAEPPAVNTTAKPALKPAGHPAEKSAQGKDADVGAALDAMGKPPAAKDD